MAVYTKISKKEIAYINKKFEVEKIINFKVNIFKLFVWNVNLKGLIIINLQYILFTNSR